MTALPSCAEAGAPDARGIAEHETIQMQRAIRTQSQRWERDAGVSFSGNSRVSHPISRVVAVSLPAVRVNAVSK